MTGSAAIFGRAADRAGAAAAVCWMAAAAIGFAAGQAAAQGLNLGGGNVPIQIFADDGIEWQQYNLIFLARGNARAVRGGVTVLADQLTAFYAEKSDGTTDIYRLDAVGKVRIKSENQTALGDKAVYDVTREILVVSGGKPRLVTPDAEITATQQLEYWEKRQMAVARGKAVAIKGKRQVRADVLAAYFRKVKGGGSKVYRVDAYDNVSVLTDKDRAYGTRGVYNVESGITTLTGQVTIERGKNELKGCKAEVNLNSGISKLFSCPGGRTQGTLQPRSGDKKSGTKK
ncbi:MAG: LptA/OstA family protein [Rhodospirillaceae bacterium]